MKKLLPYILILIILVGLFSPVRFSLALTCTTPPICLSPSVPASDGCSCTYVLLTPLPCKAGDPGCDNNGILTTFDPTQANNLGLYLNMMIKLFIGICGVLAVIMIVMGGIEYMTSELISTKEAGKERIKNAILGLLLALGSWTLLNQINPNILNTKLSSLTTQTVTVDLGGESSTPFSPINKTTLTSLGITCNNSGGNTALSATAQSFIGRSTYSMSQRNTTNTTTAFVDCSSFVSQVYVCSGLSNPGGTTAGIFGSGGIPVTNISADGTTANGAALQIGDLLGWRQGENGEKWGHVVMYIGNGQVIDAQGSGVAVRSLNSSQFQGRIKYIKKLGGSGGGGGGGF